MANFAFIIIKVTVKLFLLSYCGEISCVMQNFVNVAIKIFVCTL